MCTVFDYHILWQSCQPSKILFVFNILHSFDAIQDGSPKLKGVSIILMV